MNAFGKERAFLPHTLNGAFKDDIDIMKNNSCIDTGMKDRYGQHIFVIDLRENRKHLDYKAYFRAIFYTIMSRMDGDEGAQQNGVVCQVLPSYSARNMHMKAARLLCLWCVSGAPLRLASGQYIRPSPAFKLVFRVARLLTGELRTRFKIFDGTDEEILMKLKAYGVSRDKILDIFGGDLHIDQGAWVQSRLEQGL